ncbi:MAG: glycosyltransferase [Treponemataceae bacterium]|nr:glycosyltransferase [Treponemataceae bacterium]
MKIAVICDVLGEANNGTVFATLNLITHLKRQGHQVTVVSPDKSTAGKPGYVVMPTLNFGKFLNRIVENNGVSLAKPDKDALTAIIRDSDAVHIQFPFALGINGAKIAHQLGKPLTASFHCQAENITAHVGLLHSELSSTVIYKFFWNHLYKYCDCIHYPTEFIHQTFEEECGHQTPAYVISNGVNEKFFPTEDTDVTPKADGSRFTIVCSGRYCKEKNQSTIIRAIGKSAHRDRITLLLAGTGPDYKKLKLLAHHYKVDVQFRFFTQDALVQALRSADLYVHAAIAEIESISCLEAIAAGLVPVIADAKLSAARFFALTDDNRFESGSSSDLCRKIDYFFEHPVEKATCRMRYRKEFRNLSLSEAMTEMESMITAACGKHHA